MNAIQIIISALLSVCVLAGISMMSKVKTSVNGNLLSALAMLIGVVATLYFSGVVSAWTIYPAILIGALIGGTMARRVQMIQMPQTVALFNGLGGGASALVGVLSAMGVGFSYEQINEIAAKGYQPCVNFTSLLAVAVGMITLVGSLVAAGKLHRVLPQKPIVWSNHSVLTMLFLVLTVCLVLVGTFTEGHPFYCLIGTLVCASLFGLFFSVRVGGADMPITISLLNSLSGVAGSIAGMAISDIFLVAVGGIVGASGLLLTQIMCRAMNRSLIKILVPPSTPAKALPQSPTPNTPDSEYEKQLEQRVMQLEERIKKLEAMVKDLEARVGTLNAQIEAAPAAAAQEEAASPAAVLAKAKEVIIVPGYGMALAQAQHQVKQLAETLEDRGAHVRFAIHPVAGRMPGHMNVLLAEADVPYEKLFEMEQINDDFGKVDAVVVIGANDVLNPAAREAEGTPIYGMPVLNVDKAPEVIICNFDLKPGYAGVENPLYSREKGVYLELGDAKETLKKLISGIHSVKETAAAAAPVKEEKTPADVLSAAKEVIIVPGYGMALAQAQHQVKQLAETLEDRGAHVRFAIHPVAGRMPGHMNVLLAEADVPYEKLFEMEQINDDFGKVDAVVVIGANDVLNPAAREAEGTPIYGMPVLNVDKAPEVIICNFDLKPGYAGVENPLYTREKGVYLELGDAKQTLKKLISGIH